MKTEEHVGVENMNLLGEIADLKMKLSELYKQTGPGSSDYIGLSIKLDLLIHEYLEEKIVTLNKR